MNANELGQSLRDAVPEPMKPVIGSHRDPSPTKQGHKCCGGCCDTRRATIIVNGVNVVLIILAILNVTFSANAGKHTSFHIFCAIKLIVSIIGMIGAINYKMYLIGAAGSMYVIEAVLSIISLDFFGAIKSLFFAYPHYFLMQEIKQEIMTKENYPNEEHSMCCV